MKWVTGIKEYACNERWVIKNFLKNRIWHNPGPHFCLDQRLSAIFAELAGKTPFVITFRVK